MEEDKEELELAQELQKVCNKDGKETDLEKSTEIFHQFGRHFRKKSPDKISLIRSAVFFNAALVRQPKNSTILNDLKKLCFHVLKLAQAENVESNLLQIADDVKKRVDMLRSKAQQSLECLKIIPVGLPENELIKLKDEKIAKIKNLQNMITNLYVDIMKFITERSCTILGKTPCKFSIVGMGSLARKEITPYSDFEHIIVLEEGVQFRPNFNKILEYFRWLTVIFQLIVINLKETIIPSVSVSVLNDSSYPEKNWFFDCHTPRGISFDGMMVHASKFPLGRTQTTKKKYWTTELIKPVSEMAKYLQVEEDLKNGYHLADILTKTCFVSGNRTVYEHFETAIADTLRSTLKSTKQQIMSQLWNDLNAYNITVISKSMRLSNSCNVKRVVYRSTTLFVSALGRLFSINKYSCFDIITELQKMNKINQTIAKKLAFAIAVACETRLKVYISRKRQNDSVGKRSLNTFDHANVTQLVDIIGEQSLGDYFCIAYSLQHSLKNFDANKITLLNVSLNVQFQMLLFLDLRKFVLAESKRTSLAACNSDTEHYTKYVVAYVQVRNNNFSEALQLLVYLESCFEVSEFLMVKIKRRKAYCLFEMKRYSECIDYISESLNYPIFSNRPFTAEIFHAIGYFYAVKGDCKRKQERFEEARLLYITALKHIEDSSSSFKIHLIIKCKCFLGFCESNLGLHEEALQNGLEALQQCKGVNIEIYAECNCYRLVGQSYLRLCQEDKAMIYFQKELDLRRIHDHPDEDAKNTKTKV